MTGSDFGMVIGMGALAFGVVDVFAGHPSPGFYSLALGVVVLFGIRVYGYKADR
jgi:hypothetical protein